MTQTDVDTLAGLLPGALAQALSGVPISIATNGALPIDKDATYLATKAGVLAMTVAAPGAANIGRRISFFGTTVDQNTLTFTAGQLRAGVAGNTVWTGAAQIGSGITLLAVSATGWQMVANVAGAIT